MLDTTFDWRQGCWKQISALMIQNSFHFVPRNDTFFAKLTSLFELIIFAFCSIYLVYLVLGAGYQGLGTNTYCI